MNVPPYQPQNNIRNWRYLTNQNGSFDQAMSRITTNPTSANQGMGNEQVIFSRELFEQLQMALAIQMGLNGPQRVKEHALHNVLNSPSARGDMKQVLQSRAEIYGDDLDPKWFKQGTDLGGKAATLKQKNQARSQLAGAHLLVSQLGALELRKRLLEGDGGALQRYRMGFQTTIAEALKILGKLPPLTVLQLCNPQFGN